MSVPVLRGPNQCVSVLNDLHILLHVYLFHCVCVCVKVKRWPLHPLGLQSASEHMFVSVISWPSSLTGSVCVSPQTSPLPGEQTC